MKKRVFLDECCSDSNLGSVFGPKAHVYTAKDLGVAKKQDPTVIDRAVKKRMSQKEVTEKVVTGDASPPKCSHRQTTL